MRIFLNFSYGRSSASKMTLVLINSFTMANYIDCIDFTDIPSISSILGERLIRLALLEESLNLNMNLGADNSK